MSITNGLTPGLNCLAKTTVDQSNTAASYGSGSVDVFATPALIGLMEKAALGAVNPLLPEGYTTVGISVDVEHLAATPMGGQVEARAQLMQVDGRKLVFKVEAHDDVELVGRGTHVRFIVENAKFMQKVINKNKA